MRRWGKECCLTGEIASQHRGERITWELEEKLATEAALEDRVSVTKKLDLLVVADPDTRPIKAKKARAFGTRVIAEAAFWKSLGSRFTSVRHSRRVGGPAFGPALAV